MNSDTTSYEQNPRQKVRGRKHESLVPNYYVVSCDDTSRDKNRFKVQTIGGKTRLQSEIMSERPGNCKGALMFVDTDILLKRYV